MLPIPQLGTISYVWYYCKQCVQADALRVSGEVLSAAGRTRAVCYTSPFQQRATRLSTAAHRPLRAGFQLRMRIRSPTQRRKLAAAVIC